MTSIYDYGNVFCQVGTSICTVSKCGQFCKKTGIACHPTGWTLPLIRNILRLLNAGIDSKHIENNCNKKIKKKMIKKVLLYLTWLYNDFMFQEKTK